MRPDEDLQDGTSAEEEQPATAADGEAAAEQAGGEPEAAAAKPRTRRKARTGAAAEDAPAEAEAKPARAKRPRRKAAAETGPEAGGEEQVAAAEEQAEAPARKRAPRKAAKEAAPAAEKPAKPAAKPGRRGEGQKRTPRRRVVRAKARYVRTSARKARMVCGHLRGKSVQEARAILAYTPREVARDWSKLLESAVANAESNHELLEDDLVVREAYADEGPTIKRFRPRAMGRATPIRKRTSHLTIALSTRPDNDSR
jgi:ribosomal protein L22